jgi:hypothetical protein
MATANNSQRPVFPAELSAAMTGSWVTIGTLSAPGAVIIFDNQSTVAVAISVDGGTTTWKTFSAGEALVLDLRAAHGLAGNFSADKGTVFSGNGASGTFRISYIYARE